MEHGPGGPVVGFGQSERVVQMQKRFDRGPSYINQGDPEVRWLCKPPHPRQRDTVADIVREETRNCRLKTAWIMGGLHAEATTRWAITETGFNREMADDDAHVTVRMCGDDNTCYLHGHLYLYTETEQVAAGWRGEMKWVDVAKRLVKEKERTYIGGKPSHIWVWGSYEPESREWPRKGPNLPVPPFDRKPQYAHLDE
ncbi:hypothetical protein SCUP234_07777 [Seiridium cupressi]